jgi:hypothetical protein
MMFLLSRTLTGGSKKSGLMLVVEAKMVNILLAVGQKPRKEVKVIQSADQV